MNKVNAGAVWSLLLFTLAAAANAESTPEDLLQAENSLVKIERQLEQAPPTTRSAFTKISAVIDNIQALGKECVNTTKGEMQKANDDLAIFDVKSDDTKGKVIIDAATESVPVQEAKIADSPKIAQRRQKLDRQIIDLKEALIECTLLVNHGAALSKTVKHQKEAILAQRLLSRQENIVRVFRGDSEQDPQAYALPEIFKLLSIELWSHKFALNELLAIAIFGLLIGLAIRHRLRKNFKNVDDVESDPLQGLLLSFQTSTAYFAPLLAMFVFASLYIMAQPIFDGSSSFKHTLYDITLYVFIAWNISVFLQPKAPAHGNYLDGSPEKLRWVGRSCKFLTAVMLINWLMPEYIQDGHIAESTGTLLRTILSLLMVLSGIGVFYTARNVDSWILRKNRRWFAYMLLAGGVLAVIMGYFNLGNLIIRGVVLTPIAFMAALILVRVLKSLLDAFQVGKSSWQGRLRVAIGLKDRESMPGVGWLRVFGNGMLWLLFGYVLLHIWDVVEEGTGLFREYMFDGIELAGTTIVPARLFLAVLMMWVMLAVTRWVKSQLNTQWLAHAHMEKSAREALVTTSGYVGVGIATVAALSIAGINFANLAIVAGALSVGIGFGLQNVVNNFVSGLILLIERPIRKGDWIIVNGTEGVVRKISIRSTLLETFDQSDVIVPNSELISGQVTNWMLKNKWGRVKVPVGVAYGSDVQQVTALLLDIANEHTLIVTDRDDIPKPSVIFKQFGTDSLDFELRANVRDVNRKKIVLSDINYAIEAAFREAGIEIPFAQRDIHCAEPIRVELTDTRKPED